MLQATHAATLYRCSALLPTGAFVLALLHCALCLACAGWRSSQHPSRLRWSEAANALLRASTQLLLPLLTSRTVESFLAPTKSACAGPPAHVLLPAAALPDVLHSTARAAATATAQHAALLLWASGAPAALSCALGWRLRFRWAWYVPHARAPVRMCLPSATPWPQSTHSKLHAIYTTDHLGPPPTPLPCSASALFQLCLSAAFMRAAPSVCLAPALSSPQAQRLTHDLYALAGLPALALLGPSAAQPSALGECVSILRFLQLALALVLPLAWQLAAEAAALPREGHWLPPAWPAPRPTRHMRSPRPPGEASDEWLPFFSAAAIGAALAWECTAIASAHG